MDHDKFSSHHRFFSCTALFFSLTYLVFIVAFFFADSIPLFVYATFAFLLFFIAMLHTPITERLAELPQPVASSIVSFERVTTALVILYLIYMLSLRIDRRLNLGLLLAAWYTSSFLDTSLGALRILKQHRTQ